MARRSRPSQSKQHHKGKARPRNWHHSRSSQWVFDRKLRAIEAAFARAEAEMAAAGEAA